MTAPQSKVVVFDFDGVFVLDSEAVFKRDAWGVVLGKYGDAYKPLLAEAKNLFGYGKKGGRVETLEHVFKGLGVTDEERPHLVAEASRTFDDYVQEHIRMAGLVPGAREMLEELSQLGLRMYLNSGTATSALAVSARNLGIDNYFEEMLGSTMDPVGGSKVENLIHIAGRENVGPETMLMVGDGTSDRNASEEFGCRFLGVANRHNEWAKEHRSFEGAVEKRVSFEYVSDLRDIKKFL